MQAPMADPRHGGRDDRADDRPDGDASSGVVEHALDVPQAEQHRHRADSPRGRQASPQQSEQGAAEGQLLEDDGAERDGHQHLEQHGGRPHMDPAVIERTGRGGDRTGDE